MTTSYFVFVTTLFACLSITAQAQHPVDLGKMLDQHELNPFNRHISKGADNAAGIHLDEQPGPGIAWLQPIGFTTGVIEVDIRGKDVYQQSFVGIAFHGVNDTTYEAVYFRPFNFRATDSVRKIHAVQYIALPAYDWPKLREQYSGKYEQPVQPAPDPNGWFHVRIEITTGNIVVYVNNDKMPSLTVTPLTHEKGTMMGLWAGNASGGDWKNLIIKADR